VLEQDSNLLEDLIAFIFIYFILKMEAARSSETLISCRAVLGVTTRKTPRLQSSPLWRPQIL